VKARRPPTRATASAAWAWPPTGAQHEATSADTHGALDNAAERSRTLRPPPSSGPLAAWLAWLGTACAIQRPSATSSAQALCAAQRRRPQGRIATTALSSTDDDRLAHALFVETSGSRWS
jgi:hypothetical protein